MSSASAGTDPLQALLAAGLVPTFTYPPTSRYASAPVLTYHPADGSQQLRYLGRRLVPAPESMPLLGYHEVVAGDRLDLIAYAALGDAELWWLIPDANLCTDPAELTAVIGRRLRLATAPPAPGVGHG